MARGDYQRLSADVKTTAYLKFRRVYEDALKVHAKDRPLEARLVLSRCLLHVPPLLAAANDDPIPEPRDLPEWVDGCSAEAQQLLREAFRRSSGLPDRFAATTGLDEMLRRRLPQPEPVWESGRMRFARGFTTDSLFFAESNHRFLRRWDSWRDRGEILHGLEGFLGLVHAESPQSGREFRDLFLRAFQDTAGLRGILIFGSSAHGDGPWNQSDGKDVDLALIGLGLWFRRALCTADGMRLDILRLPEAVLKRGVEAEDDLINNALFAAEILRDDAGTCGALQKRVRDCYARGKTRPGREARERLEGEMTSWVEWAKPRGRELPDWVRLDTAASQVVKLAFRRCGRWFPSDQDLLANLESWTQEGAEGLGEYLAAAEAEEASQRLESCCEALCHADRLLRGRARKGVGESGAMMCQANNPGGAGRFHTDCQTRLPSRTSDRQRSRPALEKERRG